MSAALTKDEWIKRAEARYIAARVDEDLAAEFAESIYDDYADFYPDDPEGAAGEDMSYWED